MADFVQRKIFHTFFFFYHLKVSLRDISNPDRICGWVISAHSIGSIKMISSAESHHHYVTASHVPSESQLLSTR